MVMESIAYREFADMFLDYFALAILVIVVLVVFYGVIVIHDIPYEMALLLKSGNYPAVW